MLTIISYQNHYFTHLLSTHLLNSKRIHFHTSTYLPNFTNISHIIQHIASLNPPIIYKSHALSFTFEKPIPLPYNHLRPNSISDNLFLLFLLTPSALRNGSFFRSEGFMRIIKMIIILIIMIQIIIVII